MSITTPIQSCRLCDGKGLTQVLQLASTPPGDHYLPKERNPENLPVFPLSLQQCDTCGHVQLGAIVDPSYIYKEYIYTTKSSLGLAEHFEHYVSNTIEKLSLKPGSFVVEIGSNDGTMLKAFQKAGMKVLGVDPAKEIASQATKNGQTTIPEFFTGELSKRILSEHGHADLIVANNVIANVSNVQELVKAVQDLLAPEGVFVFETGYLKYLAEGYVFDNIYHEHIDYHSIRPLERFFHSNEMQLFDVLETNSKGNSIRCFVSHSSKNSKVSEELIALREREKTLGYHTPLPYKRLGDFLQQTKIKLHNILDSYVAKGVEISGFGASVGVTTVLYQFDLQKYIRRLLDDNTTRDGLFSPGMAIPVLLAERELKKSTNEVIVLLAWRYADNIVKRHKSNQTRFIRFFPEVEMIS